MGDLVLSTADAERLDRRIRLLTNSIGDSLSKLYDLVEQAKVGQIHVALGYASWTAYVADACRINVKIGRDQRREIVGWLSGEGMSQRAIADVVGASPGTVNADLQSGVQNRTPEPAPDVEQEHDVDDHLVDDEGIDPLEIKHGLDLLVEDGLLTPDDAEQFSQRAAEPKSTGLDDKAYPRSAKPKKPRRGPLANDASSIAHDMRRLAARINNLLDDDRFGANREQIGDAMRPYDGWLSEAAERLQTALNQAVIE